MKLLLVPGEVFLVPPTPTKRHVCPILREILNRLLKKLSKRTENEVHFTHDPQLPGLQLMATCKQACVEGYAVFYSSNVFFLPAGPLRDTHRVLATLQPQHLAMISSFGVKMSLRDLTPALLEEIHQTLLGLTLSLN